MHLFSLEDFGYRFGIDLTVSDFYEAVSEASRAATKAVASQFRLGSFDEFAGRKDYFRGDRMFGDALHPVRQFRLSRPLVDDSAGFSVYGAASLLALRNNATGLITNLQDRLDDGLSDHVILDAQHGLITVADFDVSNMWICVTYSGGLSVASDDAYEGVPDWLADVAQTQAALFLTRNRTLTAEGDTDFSVLRNAMQSALEAHGRFYPGAVLPEMSTPTR